MSLGPTPSRCLGRHAKRARRYGLIAVWFAGLAWLAVGAQPASATVKSLAELRKHNVVVQKWDLSCGAAALATILTYQHGDPVAERDVAIGLMSREEYLTNPMLVRWRHGFSLLDMKRFADARGYRGVGLGQMTFEHLESRSPAIVPIRTFGYQHFVIIRGTLGDRVLLADPAFGNRTMRRVDFERAWMELGGVGHVAFVVERTDGLMPPNRLVATPGEFLTLR